MKFPNRIIVLCAALLLFPMSLVLAQNTTPNGLSGVTWVLTQLNGEAPAHEATLEYIDGAFAGTTGCNRYNVGVSFDGDTLTTMPGITTQMACLSETQSQQETAFLDAMTAAASYTLAGDTLTLLDAEGNALMVFEADRLIGTEWVLTQINGEAPLVDSEITAVFSAEGVAGSAGCNSYTTAMTREGDTLTIGMPASTRKFCDGLMDQEATYLSALQSVTGYAVNGLELTLLDADGNEVLVFSAQANNLFSGTSWTLIALNGAAPLADTTITLSFDDTRLSGSAGCNRYFASYSTVGSRFSAGQAGSTMMACAEPIMAQEAAYLSALDAAAGWVMEGDELALLDANGAELLHFTSGSGT